MEESQPVKSQTWRTVGGDLSDLEWELIADLVEPYSSIGKIGRPVKHDRRDILNAIFFVTATGCQWRNLPASYPHWNTVHRYHVTWSKDGTWERIADRLRGLVRETEGRESDPSAGIIDARSVRGTPTVTSSTRGYDAGKKISGRKVFGIVDTIGLLIAVTVMVASASDNAGGIAVFDAARPKSARLKRVWVDGGFKKAFAAHCRAHHVAVEVVNRIHRHEFVVLPRRWVVERTWSWLMANRRLQVDYERDPEVTEGFVWAAHSRLLLHRLTQSAA
jgi:transposase